MAEQNVSKVLGGVIDGEALLRSEIDQKLTSGKWAGGMRLPTERRLSEEFGIARTRVRRVLEEFVLQGRINRTVGSGTFVTKQHGTVSIDAREVESVSPEDLMEVRVIVEPQMADLLVRRASQADLDAISDLIRKGRHSMSMAGFEELDHAFHMALAVATKNQYLIGLITRIQAVRQSRAWTNLRRRGLTEDRQKTYQQQHETIYAALEARDANALRHAILTHLQGVRQNLGF